MVFCVSIQKINPGRTDIPEVQAVVIPYVEIGTFSGLIAKEK